MVSSVLIWGLVFELRTRNTSAVYIVSASLHERPNFCLSYHQYLEKIVCGFFSNKEKKKLYTGLWCLGEEEARSILFKESKWTFTYTGVRSFICARVLVMSEVFWNGWFSNLAYCLFFSITVFLFSTTPCTSTNPRHPIGEYFSSYQMASLVPKTVAASLKLAFIFLLWNI